MTPLVEVRNLRKTYGATVAVEDVSLAVEPGEILGILGPNGAGKTTTVECISGLRQADGGSIRVLGVDPQRHPEALRERLGVQLQHAALPPKLRVAEAVRLYASFYDAPVDGDELLAVLGLDALAGRAYGQLSGGERQRLSIALALVGGPEVAILDELTTGLDPAARRATWDLIDAVRRRGVTILLVTHFMDEAERLCDRVVIIDGGRVVAAGSPAELTRPADGERAFRMRLPAGVPGAVAERLADLPDVIRVTADDGEHEVVGGPRVLPAAILALAEQGVVPDEVRTLTRSLEDVFVELTASEPESEEVSR